MFDAYMRKLFAIWTLFFLFSAVKLAVTVPTTEGLTIQREKILGMEDVTSDPVTVNLPEEESYVVIPKECGTISVPSPENIDKSLNLSWPWMAAVFTSGRIPKHQGATTAFLCAGTLITRKHVISAAHCFVNGRKTVTPSENLSVQLGANDMKKDSNHTASANFEVRRVIVHEDFDIVSYHNDIAVLELREPVPSSTGYILPACLPYDNETLKHFSDLDEKDGLVTGWESRPNGNGTFLQEKVVFWEQEDCEDEYIPFYEQIIESQVCVSDPDFERSPCQADPGGPALIARKDGTMKRYFIVGITSYGINDCQNTELPAVYTRVTFFLNWILKHIGPEAS